MRRLARLLLASSMFGAAIGFVACGGSTGAEDPFTPGSGGDPDAGLALDGGDDDSGFGVGCTPACVAPQVCSVTNACIDEGTCAADGDCKAGMKCDPATKTCAPGGECGSQKAEATAIPPNMLIVLDRSCSMRSNVSGKPKWTIAVDALKSLTTKYAGKIRFGLSLFPDTVGNQCTQGAIPIHPAVANEPKISKLLTDSLKTSDPNYPDGPCVTNIDTAMQQAQGCPELKDATRTNYALLVSDGAQAGCNAAGGDKGTEAIIADMAKVGIKTFVVGFGGGVDGAQLDKFAVAGGVPAAGATKYYKAEDEASLAKVLDTIGSAALGCVFTLDKTPPDPAKIFVFFDGTTEVSRDPANGWQYDPATNTVTFFGAACADIKAEKVKSVDIVLGCKATPA